jgi:hypothetical protein
VFDIGENTLKEDTLVVFEVISKFGYNLNGWI